MQQLERAQDVAIQRERLHVLEQVTGGIAHDINNSLLAVNLYSELILQHEENPQTRKWTEGVHTAARDISSIVLRLRQFNGRSVDQESTTPIDLKNLVEEALQLTRPKWHDDALRQQKDISVSLDTQVNPTIVGDASGLRSVLTNLIFNAVDAIQHAGNVVVRVAEEGSTAIFEVVDNGKGMDSDDLQRCLEPFYTTKKGGTGLGLSVCHGIVKSHGGKLEIISTPGVGTTIRVILPASIPVEAAEALIDTTATSVNSARSHLESKRILCIDDNQVARDSSEALLASMGIAVDTAVDASSGLSLLQERSYDAVITDLSMPGMDGLQLTAEIKRLWPSMPVVVISGWSTVTEHANMSAAQPDQVLPKQFSFEQLSEALIGLLPANSH